MVSQRWKSNYSGQEVDLGLLVVPAIITCLFHRNATQKTGIYNVSSIRMIFIDFPCGL